MHLLHFLKLRNKPLFSQLTLIRYQSCEVRVMACGILTFRQTPFKGLWFASTRLTFFITYRSSSNRSKRNQSSPNTPLQSIESLSSLTKGRSAVTTTWTKEPYKRNSERKWLKSGPTLFTRLSKFFKFQFSSTSFELTARMTSKSPRRTVAIANGKLPYPVISL